MHGFWGLKRLLAYAALFTILWVLNPAGSSYAANAEKGIPQIFKEEGRAVIVVSNLGQGNVPQGFGSGFIVRPNGTLVTNFHVVERATAVSIQLPDGREFPVTGIVALNSDYDIAILRVDADNLPAVTLGDSEAVSVGERIIAIGSPMGLENTVSDGLVSSVREEEGEKVFQISAPISHGSSGGALLNMKGEVIGVIFGLFEEGQNLNFAIPVNYVKQMLGGPVKPFNAAALVPEQRDCPVIANRGSRIYHLPGGQFYDQMRFSPDRVCFEIEEEAIRAGLRRSKR